MKEKVAVIGLGYVGLPLALAAANANYSVVGIESNSTKVESINRGLSPVDDITDGELKSIISHKDFIVTSEIAQIVGARIIIICVPTPIKFNGQPDLSFLANATYAVGKYVNRECLVILESTVEPGTTLHYLAPILERESNLHRQDIKIVYSPERIDPSNDKWTLRNIPKLVAGNSNNATKEALSFYSKFIDSVIKCETIEIAECAKLLENSFRYINISFINEFSIFCNKLGIDVKEVIAAASTKPYGFMPFSPSIGVGGHCIPVDPLYLANKANEIGAPIKSIELAHAVNKDMPLYFVRKAEEKIGPLTRKRILVVGISYKPNISDVRESAVKSLIFNLRSKGALVDWHDDLVKEWNDEQSAPLDSNYDLIILAAVHKTVNLELLKNVPVLDTSGSIF